MLDLTQDARRIAVWVAMADHFLDTETRHDIPLTALRCLEAGLGVAEARDVWCFEVSPVLAFNLWSIAGNWAVWDRAWLVDNISWRRRRRPGQPGIAAWLGYFLSVHLHHGTWLAIERCMQLLLGVHEPAERARVAGDMGLLANRYFDCEATDYRTLGDDALTRLEALYPEPFQSIMKPAVFCGETREGEDRVRAALQSAEVRTPRAIDLWSHFAGALAQVRVTCTGSALFDELVVRYREAHRHYHTLRHIESCLVWLDECAAAAERPAEVALALWFHDAIYDPRAHDNEQRSADLARSRLRAIGVHSAVVERIAAHILATYNHESDNPDSQLLLDLDLSILGATPEQFDAFERGIRQEFAHVSRAAFSVGRRGVLRRFLDRSTIYRSPALREKFEARARANLQRRISELMRL